MHRFCPPKKPSGFDKDTAAIEAAVDLAVTESQAHAAKNPNAKVKKVNFPDKWGSYKSQIAKATRGRCGYCDGSVADGQNGDVEHYYPKGAIWNLSKDASERGQDERWTAKVEGRKRDVASNWGYWWKAYDWDNYLLSCLACNQKWKLSYFPVKTEGKRKLPPRKNEKETPLLLNPFFGLEPVKHLQFLREGSIKARRKSVFGQATIDVCGLDRLALTKERRKTARTTHRLVREYNRLGNDEEESDQIMFDLFEEGNPNNRFSSIVRIIFEQDTKTSWAALTEIVITTRAPLLIDRYLKSAPNSLERKDILQDIGSLVDPEIPHSKLVQEFFEAQSNKPWIKFLSEVRKADPTVMTDDLAN